VRTVKLTLAYDGTAYLGWQRQPEGTSIQGLIEEALGRLEGAPVAVAGAGRTDAGVHALGQVAAARLQVTHDADTICRALNATLPPDIRVLRVDDVDASFHPRFHARGKTYQYWIWNAPVLPPGLRTWCWHVPRTLDAARMDAAARLLEGTHDFAAFQSTGSDVATTIRTVASARVVELPITAGVVPGAADAVHPFLAQRLLPGAGRFLVFEIEADGFLRHMVRALAGTLVEVGDGRRDASAMRDLVAGRDRGAAGATAPARGLVLVRVRYGEP
jgi:tRNA pseudouridine38-40 synthase